MLEIHESVTLRKIKFLDAGDDGLVLFLETQQSPTHGQSHTFGCLMDETLGRQFLREFSNALELKWGKNNLP